MKTQQVKQMEESRTIICTTCHIQFNKVIDYKLHLSTEFHVYNTKRRVAELGPINEDVFEAKKAAMIAPNASALSEVHFKCQPCNKNFKSEGQLAEHTKSKKHKKSEKEYLVKHPDADKDSIFKSFSQAGDGSTSLLN